MCRDLCTVGAGINNGGSDTDRLDSGGTPPYVFGIVGGVVLIVISGVAAFFAMRRYGKRKRAFTKSVYQNRSIDDDVEYGAAASNENGEKSSGCVLVVVFHSFAHHIRQCQPKYIHLTYTTCVLQAVSHRASHRVKQKRKGYFEQ